MADEGEGVVAGRVVRPRGDSVRESATESLSEEDGK
jgi:hypothetical protein